jgi:hypothetical protein
MVRRMSNVIVRFGVVLGLSSALALAGCSKKSEGGAGGQQAPAVTAPSPATATTPGTAAATTGAAVTDGATAAPGAGARNGEGLAPPPPPPSAPQVTLVKMPVVENPPAAGPAYLAVSRTGVLKLQDGKFEVVPSASKNIKSLILGPHDTLYAVSYEGLLELKDGRLQKIPGQPQFHSPDIAALGPQGELWTADFEGLGRYDGTAWTNEEKSALGADVTLLKGIAVDPAGRVWVASSNALHVKENGAWRTESVSALIDGTPFFDTLAIVPGGEIWAAAGDTLLRAKDAKWEKVALGGGDSYLGGASAVVVGGGGRICVFYVLGAIACVLPDGRAVAQEWRGEDSGDMLRGAAMDGAGRLWIASDAGLRVLDPAGEETLFPPGTIAEAPGRIDAIAVAGAGPVLPVPGEVRKGSVTGKILRGGQPLAGLTTEICPSPAIMFQDTPCAEGPFHQSVQTDAAGVFTFTDVPISTYGFAVDVDGKWATSLFEDCCEGMQPGRAFDVGTFTLDE